MYNGRKIIMRSWVDEEAGDNQGSRSLGASKATTVMLGTKREDENQTGCTEN